MFRPSYCLVIVLGFVLACVEQEEPSEPVYTGPCIGLEPGEEQRASAPGPLPGPDGAPSDVTPELGAESPAFALADFQPQSCGFSHHYGLDLFRGRVTVAVLLASW